MPLPDKMSFGIYIDKYPKIIEHKFPFSPSLLSSQPLPTLPPSSFFLSVFKTRTHKHTTAPQEQYDMLDMKIKMVYLEFTECLFYHKNN